MRGLVPILLLSLSGCSFVLDFGEFTTAERDAGAGDAGDAGGSPDAGDGGDGGSVPDGCTPSDEICNGVDDDCDGETDEAGFADDDPDNCGACEIACASGYECIGGTCENQVVELAAGSDFACARTLRGEVWCWGGNTYGQIGTGTVGGTVAMPHRVADVTTDRGIGAGAAHACAATADRTYCWGEGASGQLGNGGSSSPAPTGEIGTGAVQVALGAAHTCIRTGTAEVECAGANDQGALGIDVVEASWFETNVELPTTVRDLAAGSAHTCAILTEGSVYCWGDNADGQLGAPAGGGFAPQLATAAVGVTDIEAGEAHTCGVLPSGGARCWGANANGQLGLGTTSTREPPTELPALAEEPVSQLALGRDHTCALLADGAVWCWGLNDQGQLGTGTMDPSPEPVRVELPPARAIAAGDSHTCAALVAPEVYCWGANDHGQLGTGSPSGARRLPDRTLLP